MRRLPAALLGALLLFSLGGAPTAARTPALRVPEIGTWVFHFDDLMPDAALPTQAALMREAASDARLLVALSARRHLPLARSMYREAEAPVERIEFVCVDGPLSPWARDRYVVLDRLGDPVVLLPPREALDRSWSGDVEVGAVLADRDRSRRADRIALHVEGGDLLLGERVALVGALTIAEEQKRLRAGRRKVLAALGHASGRQVVLVGEHADDLPHGHLDMFLTLLDDDTLLLGDPRLSRSYFEAARELGLELPDPGEYGGMTWAFQLEMAEKYDLLAKQLGEAGFRIERIPIVHSLSDTVLTWNNVVMETRGSETRVYVPRYGVPHLDRRAEGVWRRLGFTPRMIPAESIILHGGAVRCVTNELRRREAAYAPGG